MKVELRDPNLIMKLSRLGSFHQSKLSFLRSFLNEFKDWEYKRDLFDLDKDGFGVVVYSFKKKDRVYSLICFANEIQDGERSDRVIATKWDAAFTLYDGVPNKDDIDRLKIWEELRDSILPDSPIQDAFDYACLYLSINPDNLDVYKGGFVRYGKVNKKKIQGYIELTETESMDLTDCNFSKD